MNAVTKLIAFIYRKTTRVKVSRWKTLILTTTAMHLTLYFPSLTVFWPPSTIILVLPLPIRMCWQVFVQCPLAFFSCVVLTAAIVITEALQSTLSPNYLTVEDDDCSFTFTQHCGGSVHYRTDDFIERNRDFLPADLIEVMRSSSNPRLASIFTNKLTRTGHVTTDPSVPNPPAKSQKYVTAPHKNKVRPKM